ncbi:cytochrome P450 [Epithele typhae]|uniref:cytochrome P450 n=1 Tax=Epithele typhae TaxID=378194 RepID=UPI002007B925|nr:cytochrome P450 [Epithele typhae]KAH9915437.1 cytochrome P450 [Epithele typhae]
MTPPESALSCLAASVLAWIIWAKLLKSHLSPLRQLRGPPTPSWFYGHVHQMTHAHSVPLMQTWLSQFGPNILTRWMLMEPALWTADPRALEHILHSPNYVKPWEARVSASRIIGNGIILAEGHDHRKQNPAFGPIQIQAFTEIFLEKAKELRDIWSSRASSSGEPVTVNVVDWLERTTLDAIAETGFGLHLDSLNMRETPNALQQAFHDILSVPPEVSIFRLLMDMVPQLDFFPDERTRSINNARRMIRDMGLRLVEEKRRELSFKTDDTRSPQPGRDLITLLLQANMDPDLPEDRRLNEEEILSQIPSFLVAGHESSSMAATWCLFALAQNPTVQTTLRKELLAIPSDTPPHSDLLRLPYLDSVVRETLRLHAPVVFTLRAALADDIVPTSAPFTDCHGTTRHEIKIARGNRVVLPFLLVNQSKALWGDDALEFKPERWTALPEAASKLPGLWSNLLTFSSGPRSCMGYRFAISELKALVFTLVRAFEFELAVDPAQVTRVGMLVQRPAIVGELEKGAQLPMRVQPFRRDD